MYTIMYLKLTVEEINSRWIHSTNIAVTLSQGH